jgi:hypothetical protein
MPFRLETDFFEKIQNSGKSGPLSDVPKMNDHKIIYDNTSFSVDTQSFTDAAGVQLKHYSLVLYEDVVNQSNYEVTSGLAVKNKAHIKFALIHNIGHGNSAENIGASMKTNFGRRETTYMAACKEYTTVDGLLFYDIINPKHAPNTVYKNAKSPGYKGAAHNALDDHGQDHGRYTYTHYDCLFCEYSKTKRGSSRTDPQYTTQRAGEGYVYSDGHEYRERCKNCKNADGYTTIIYRAREAHNSKVTQTPNCTANGIRLCKLCDYSWVYEYAWGHDYSGSNTKTVSLKCSLNHSERNPQAYYKEIWHKCSRSNCSENTWHKDKNASDWTACHDYPTNYTRVSGVDCNDSKSGKCACRNQLDKLENGVWKKVPCDSVKYKKMGHSFSMSNRVKRSVTWYNPSATVCRVSATVYRFKCSGCDKYKANGTDGDNTATSFDNAFYILVSSTSPSFLTQSEFTTQQMTRNGHSAQGYAFFNDYPRQSSNYIYCAFCGLQCVYYCTSSRLAAYAFTNSYYYVSSSSITKYTITTKCYKYKYRDYLTSNNYGGYLSYNEYTIYRSDSTSSSGSLPSFIANNKTAFLNNL